MQNTSFKYINIDGTIYYPLWNVDNCNCYMITVLHILHSSPTLTKIINDNKNELSKKFPTLFSPLIEYNELTENNFDHRNNIRKSLVVNKPVTTDGFNWINLLSSYYIPIIYTYCDINILINILKECSIERKQLCDASNETINEITNNEMEQKNINESINNYINDNVVNKIRNNIYDNNLQYNVTALEMFYEGKCVHGHVAAVINYNNTLYVIDKNSIMTLHNYFNVSESCRFDILRIAYTGDNLINLYKQQTDFNKNIVYDNRSWSVNISRTHDTPHKKMHGGNEKYHINIMFVYMIVSVIVSIIISIVVTIINNVYLHHIVLQPHYL